MYISLRKLGSQHSLIAGTLDQANKYHDHAIVIRWENLRTEDIYSSTCNILWDPFEDVGNLSHGKEQLLHHAAAKLYSNDSGQFYEAINSKLQHLSSLPETHGHLIVVCTRGVGNLKLAWVGNLNQNCQTVTCPSRTYSLLCTERIWGMLL